MSNGAKPQNLILIMGTNGYTGHRRNLQGVSTANAAAFYNTPLNSGRGIPYANLYFETIPIIYDTNCTSTAVFLLDTETTYMIGLNGSVFKLAPWRTSEESTGEWSRLTTISQVVGVKPNNNQYIYVS